MSAEDRIQQLEDAIRKAIRQATVLQGSDYPMINATVMVAILSDALKAGKDGVAV